MSIFAFIDTLTALELPGSVMLGGAEWDINVSLKPISQAADIRRTVNGDAVSVARDVFKKQSISISGSGMRLPAIDGLSAGQRIEVILPEPQTIAISPATTDVILPRAALDVVGLSGAAWIAPISQPDDNRPIVFDADAARIAAVRAQPSVSFASAVSAVRFRSIFSCIVTSISASADERQSSMNFTLELEEV